MPFDLGLRQYLGGGGGGGGSLKGLVFPINGLVMVT